MQGDLFGQILEGLKSFYHSSFFSGLKFVLVIYITVLLVDIVLALILKGLGADIRQSIKGIKMPTISPSRMKKKWGKIKARLESENVSQYKVAIIEADGIIEDVIAKIGYAGKNMTERLDLINPGQLENLEEIRRAHQVRNRIIHEADFPVDKKMAEEIIGTYEKLLKHLELL
jgi:hypothetical protein